LKDKFDDEDIELITRIQNGSTSDFRILVDTYKDTLLTLAISIVKDERWAEDIIQEVFIKVFKNIGGFRYRSKFSTWLYRITVNTAYSALKKHSNKKCYNLDAIELNRLANTSNDHALSDKDQRLYIKKAMKMLKTDEALVLRLFYLCEMNLKEVEKITKFSAPKVRVDLHRGRLHLKSHLEKLLGGEINQLL
jgi:RNA polymerase sigma factor (sigma-70 family)